jgi:hypothetical protein
MSTTTLAPTIRGNTSGVHARPRLGRLIGVELRKMGDTRAGSGCWARSWRSPSSRWSSGPSSATPSTTTSSR